METLNNYIVKGKKFELIKIGKDGNKERFISRFLSKSPNFYTIAPPQIEGLDHKLTPGEIIKLYVYTSDGVFSIDCEVMKKGEGCYQISLPHNIKHSQRREFLRVNKKCMTVINIYKPDGTIERISTLTRDICGRGMSILTDVPLGDYDKIDVELLIDELVIQTLGEMVYTKPVNTKGGSKFLSAFMFISVTEREVDSIVKACLLYQLQERKRQSELNEAVD